MDRREFLGAAMMFGFDAPAVASPGEQLGRTSIAWREGHFQTHFIYTGVSETVFLIYPDGTSLLIDCGDHPACKRGKYAVPILPSGERHAGEWIARYVKRVNPRGSAVDYMLLTHYHNDHGGCRSYHAGLAPNGEYYLSGFGQAMEELSFDKAIDRAWPTFDDPLPRRVEDDCWMLMHMKGVYRELQRRGTKVERFRLEREGDQLCPLHGGCGSDFRIRPLFANGRVLMPDGAVKDLYADYIARAHPTSVNENAMSIGLKFGYGPFSLYTGGDFEDLVPSATGGRHEIEEDLAETVGATTVAKVNHHGNKSMCAKLVTALRSQVYVGCVWDWFHMDDATLTRLSDRRLYPDDRLICPGVLTKARRVRDQDRPWMKDVPTACYDGAHIVVDVPPGGQTYAVSFVSAADETDRVISTIKRKTVA